MRVVFHTNNLSPHQLPLADAVSARVGRENFLFVYEERRWMDRQIEADVRVASADDPLARPWLETAEALYVCGLRPIDLLERRAQRGLTTLYASERWFKPLLLRDDRWAVPGRLRLLVPWYRKMANRFVKAATCHPCVKFLPIGPWAAADFRALGVPPDKMIPWGYFVAPSRLKPSARMSGQSQTSSSCKILWVGRMLKWKRVETIVRAVRRANEWTAAAGLPPFALTLVGEGPEKPILERACRNSSAVSFLPRVGLSEVRRLMREHDLYVLASDAQEGWGAVVNEALEEGLSVLATRESGAGAAMLPKERLFAAGDWRDLAHLLMREVRRELPPCSIGEWTADAAAERLLKGV